MSRLSTTEAIMSIVAFTSIFSVVMPQPLPRLRSKFPTLRQQQSLLYGKGVDWTRWAGASAVFRTRRQGNGIAQQCAEDLFALFGGHVAASRVEESRAQELSDSVRVLAPDSHLAAAGGLLYGVELEHKPSMAARGGIRAGGRRAGNGLVNPLRNFKELIASPPEGVQKLARKTVEWGGDVNVVLSALAPQKYTVPDVEGSTEDHCTLTKFDYGQRFHEKEVTEYMALLFHAIYSLSPAAGLNISLSRYDLFHGHMFTAYKTGRLGILFHSREYPAYNSKSFPLNLGYCQKGSDVPYDESMALRNIVWLAPMPDCSPALGSTNNTCSKRWLAPGALFVLDTGEGNILDRELVPDYLDVVHTVSEDDLGDVMLDVNYFNFTKETLETRVFLC